MTWWRLFCFGLFCLSAMEGAQAEEVWKFNGSALVSVDQRFFKDHRFGNVNGFSEWGAIHFDVSIGVYEFPFRIEPVVGLGFIKNESSLYALAVDGSIARDGNGDKIKSEDSLEYLLFTPSMGLRWKAWEPDTFVLSPFVQALATFRFGRVKKNEAIPDPSVQRISWGGDFGADLLGGLLISFFYDRDRESEMSELWGMKDFGMTIHGRYLPAGLMKQGFGLVDNTGGYSFGLGLFMDW